MPLILERRVGESIVIDHRITVTVHEIGKNKIWLDIAAPKEVDVNRLEVEERQRTEGKKRGTE